MVSIGWVAVAFVVMLVPSWLSDGAPHYGRLTGIWPTLFLLPAWGLVNVGNWLQGRVTPWLAWGLVALAIVVSGVWSTRDVFGPYAASPEIHDVYRGAAIQRGEQVAALVAAGPTYVTPGVWNQTPVRMVNAERPPRSFDPRHGLSVADVPWTPPGGTPRDVPACALDVERVRAGAAPDARMVMVGSQRVPYWQGGRAYAPYASGYFGAFSPMDWMFAGLLFGGLGGFDALGGGLDALGDGFEGLGDGIGDGIGAIGDGIGVAFGGFDF